MFGKLVAIGPTPKRAGGYIVWETQCDCGNYHYAASSNLLRGATKSCGCLTRNDLTGRRFGKLVAICQTNKRRNSSIVWKLICDCGREHFTTTNILTSGSALSCGCTRKVHKGPSHYKWNPNKTDEERIVGRKYYDYAVWRNLVFERDSYTCCKCGDSTGGNLNAHHVESYTDNPELRTELSNGVTLCEVCHKDYHHIYGWGHATREKIEEWMNE